MFLEWVADLGIRRTLRRPSSDHVLRPRCTTRAGSTLAGCARCWPACRCPGSRTGGWSWPWMSRRGFGRTCRARRTGCSAMSTAGRRRPGRIRRDPPGLGTSGSSRRAGRAHPRRPRDAPAQAAPGLRPEGRPAAEARSGVPLRQAGDLARTRHHHPHRHPELWRGRHPGRGPGPSEADPPGRLAGPRRRTPADRRDVGRAGGRASVERAGGARGVVVVLEDRRCRRGRRPGLAGVPAAVRPGAHVPVVQAGPRLDPAPPAGTGRGGPVDLADHRCLHQLRLARPLTRDLRHPWEKLAAPGRLTPARVRRTIRNLRQHMPCSARAPKPHRPAPHSHPAPRYDVGKTVRREKTLSPYNG